MFTPLCGARFGLRDNLTGGITESAEWFVAGLTYRIGAVVDTITLVIGEQLGSYEVVSKIGEGGMGTVYLAKHHLLGRKAAVKVLLPELCRKKDVVERFFNEARAATLIQHGGIVDVFDFGVAGDGSAYLVMEFLNGESISERMARLGKMPQADVVRLGRQAASALAAAHREGIIHRDLKPDNIVIVPDSEVAGGERIKILDFGIAKLTTEDPQSSKRTRTGMIMGTPDYMAPEQCRGAGGELDGRVDIYSVGCVLYEMICGKVPFDGVGAWEVIAKHIQEPPTSPRSHTYQISDALESLILRCLAKDPQERFDSMDALVAAFDSLSNRRFASASDALPPTAKTVVAYPAALPTPPPVTPPGVPAQSPDGKLATTLRGSTGEVASGADTRGSNPVRRKTLAVVAASSLALGAIGAAAFTFIGSNTSGGDIAAGSGEGREAPEEGAGSGDPREAPEEREPVVTSLSVADAGPGPEGDDDAAALPEPETVLFDIRSEPAGAVVFDESGALAGVTPLDLEVEKDGETSVFTVRAPHYEQEEIELVADGNREKEVALQREPDADRASSSPRTRRQAPRTESRDRPAPRDETSEQKRQEPAQPEDGADEQEPEPDPFGSPR